MSTLPAFLKDLARCTNRVPFPMGPAVTFSAERTTGLYSGSSRGSARKVEEILDRTVEVDTARDSRHGGLRRVSGTAFTDTAR